MNWKTLALCSVMAGSAMLVGCPGSSPGGDSGTPEGDGGPAQTVTYVIGAIDTETDDMSQAYGFNLDMMDGGPAGTCQDQMDYTSPYGGSGVDNQLGGMLAGTLDGLLGGDGVNGAIRDQIEAGKVLLMLQVSGINSFNNDSDIMVHAVLGEVQPSGPACRAHADMASCQADTSCSFTAASCSGTMMTACQAHTDMASCNGDTANGCAYAVATCSTTVHPTASTECPAHTDQVTCEGDMAHACNWSMAAMACSGIASGQTFHMLTDLGNVAGSITGGQISATTDNLPLSFAAMGRTITLTLHSVRFGGHITASGITNGQFGAQIIIAELQATIARLGFTGIDITAFATPDLMPSPTDPTTCLALSAGMGYSAVTANLN